MLVSSDAPLHLPTGNTFGGPYKALKIPRKVVYCIYEKGTYQEGRAVASRDFHLGSIEFSVVKLSLLDIEDIINTQEGVAFNRSIVTEEKIYFELAETIQRSTTFPFEEAYSTLEIFLVNEPSEYLHPEAFRLEAVPFPWVEADLDCFDLFDHWCFHGGIVRIPDAVYSGARPLSPAFSPPPVEE